MAQILRPRQRILPGPQEQWQRISSQTATPRHARPPLSAALVTKIALCAAIILSTAFSALTAANAGANREQSSGTGAACYDRDGGIVSCNWR